MIFVSDVELPDLVSLNISNSPGDRECHFRMDVLEMDVLDCYNNWFL